MISHYVDLMQNNRDRHGQPSNIVTIDVLSYQPQASVAISSDWLRGYDVYVDDNYKGTEGLYGQPSGRVIVTMPGNQYHTIAVYGNGFSSRIADSSMLAGPLNWTCSPIFYFFLLLFILRKLAEKCLSWRS